MSDLENKKIKKVRRKVTRSIPRSGVPEEAELIVRGIAQNPEHVALVDSVYSKVIVTLAGIINGEEGITVRNIIVVVDTTMRAVGKLRMLSGMEKKALTITIIHKILEVVDMREEDRETLKIVVEAMLDPLIDQIFAIAPKLYGKIKTGLSGLSCCKGN